MTAHTSYQQYFGLTAELFAADLPPEKLFQGEGFKEVAARFAHVLEHRGIFLLTGAPGAGKTSVLRYLLSTLSPKAHYPLYLPLSTVSTPEFYRQLNRALGGEEHYFKADTYRSIQAQVLSFATTKNLLPVIVLDEAHLLQEQNFRELQLILNFRMDTLMPLVLVLAGQPALAKRLLGYDLESFHQRIALKSLLVPLGDDEVLAFIRHHLRLCGTSDKILTPEALRMVVQLSHGLPRVIGQLIRKALMSCAQRSEKTVGEEDVLAASKEVFQ